MRPSSSTATRTRCLAACRVRPPPRPAPARNRDGDRERIGQVLSRFLANAHKFSPLEKPVHVGLDSVDSLVEVWVADHGPGVPAAEQEHVWERFCRVEGLSHVSGSSVGLAIDSIEGEGTSVAISFPQQI